MSANFDDLFNLPLDDFKEEKKEVKNFERYNPQAKDGEGNVYTAVVRFLPWFKDPNNNERGKRVCWLENLATGDKRYVDCGKEIGQKDVITDLFFKLKKSESAKDQELSKMFKTTQKYASLIQVVKDKQHPELEGKIMVWQYGITIHDKIEEMKHPEYGKPCNPRDLFNGRPMQVKVVLKAGFNNFDNCSFLNDSLPITIDGEEMEPTAECKKKIFEWLQTNSPDLDKYGVQPWDKETEDFVKGAIAAAIPGERIMSDIQTSAPKKVETAAPKKETKKAEDEFMEAPKKAKKDEDSDLDIDDINFDEDDLDGEDLYSKL